MKRKSTQIEIDEVMATFCPFSYMDIEKAIEVIQEADEKGYLNTNKLFDICDDFCDSTGSKMHELDPVATVYDYYHQIARTDIESATGKDISNDAPYHGVNVAGNYMCTSFDGKDEDVTALKDLINTIPEAERTPATKWLLSALN